jgi:hypothetical protein
MFRRRGMRPPRRAFAPDIPPMLQRANELMASADYVGAAVAFEQLARAAEARNGPRAPMLFLQAGRARFYADQLPAAMAHFKHGLDLSAQRGQGGRVLEAGSRIIGELKLRGHTRAAGEFEVFLQGLLPDFSNDSPAPPAPKRTRLPTHCPSCGAALRPEELEWLDENTAECAYCGSPVRGED